MGAGCDRQLSQSHTDADSVKHPLTLLLLLYESSVSSSHITSSLFQKKDRLLHSVMTTEVVVIS